ncbi:ABC transporter permease [Cognatishimia sp. 1_MG-2023]|uniref:ABC transporter permease n=1 Tax=Cognatishimia sp. 1_MG-2023 TaxID=3062642 RepID=UPI0026E464A4|nr:ABC transporter permease [Cognatishimia sp. 1_MG-2023]MDO6728204.1 ABC transporter permease [Cognatishimia sp. 1_MG-2023]
MTHHSRPSTQEHYVAPFDDVTSFEELKDAPPPAKFKLTFMGKIGAVVVTFWVLIALLGPFIAPLGENELPFPDAYSEFQAPQPGAWLGTDVDDRDVLSRLMFGASRTLGIAFAATIIAYFFGVILGIGAIVAGPKVDLVVSRINDAFMSLPTIMLGLVVVAAVGSSIPILILTAGFIYTTVVFRLARGIGMDIIVMDYVEAAKVRGDGIWWIVTREIWPNAAMPLISDFGLRLIIVILFISSLGFLGLGVQPPQADWGSMVRENLGALQYGESYLPVIAPAVAIATLTVGINLVVDDISSHAGRKLSGRM